MVLTLSHPERHNELAPGMYAAAVEALNMAADSNEVRCVVLTGEGNTFSGDTRLRTRQAGNVRPYGGAPAELESLHNWIEELRTFPKPVIAAVEGAAIGAGFSLALACDFVVAASNAVFEVAGSDGAAAGGADWHLARFLPVQACSGLLMQGEAITAQRLIDWGFVTQLSAPGRALDDALLLAQVLERQQPLALARAKEVRESAATRNLQQHLAAERNYFQNEKPDDLFTDVAANTQ